MSGIKGEKRLKDRLCLSDREVSGAVKDPRTLTPSTPSYFVFLQVGRVPFVPRTHVPGATPGAKGRGGYDKIGHGGPI